MGTHRTHKRLEFLPIDLPVTVRVILFEYQLRLLGRDVTVLGENSAELLPVDAWLRSNVSAAEKSRE